jgi:hypothetical protein
VANLRMSCRSSAEPVVEGVLLVVGVAAGADDLEVVAEVGQDLEGAEGIAVPQDGA